MKILELIKDVEVEKVLGDTDVEVSGLSIDNRKVKRGDIFFCYKGISNDTHSFFKAAIASGAVALVSERELDTSVLQIIVKNGRKAMAQISRAFYGYADEKLKIIAVTGTNGKTTTTFMLNSIFKAAGKKTGIIGTLGIVYDEKFIAPELTTPDPICLHGTLADMLSCGVEYVFMEASAHALYLDKLSNVKFEVGVFTNCTQDHLDFFKDMREYAKVKKRLFESGACKYSVINSDDPTGIEILSKDSYATSYGIKNPADVFAIDIAEGIGGSKFVINLFDELYEFELGLPAMHNVYNALGAAAAAKLCSIKTHYIAKGLASLKSVSGRLERVAHYNGADIFVDFAHTPDGLEKSLLALKKFCSGKLVCLFGCGGNRDTTKRPVMGKIAAQQADICIITSDNPRFEDPYDIISQIEIGVKSIGKPYVSITNRETATNYAISILGDGDILLVAGKGGEYYQEIMGIKHSYNDNEVIKKIIG